MHTLSAAVVLGVVLAVTACGGGGGQEPQANASGPYTIGGSVTGLAAGDQVTLLNNGADPLTLTANGAFAFNAPLAHDTSYAVTVGTQPVGATCTVTQGVSSSITANVSNIQVTCSTHTFTISGTLSGLGAGKEVTLLNNASDPVVLSANGTFSFSAPVSYGGGYNVSIGAQPPGQTCSVQSGTGAGTTTNVSNVAVSCVDTCVTMLSGVLATHASFGAVGSPYCISGSLQIPSGVTAAFGAGTEIRGGRIVVQGSLNVAGSPTERVRFTDVEVVPAGLPNAYHTIRVVYADISGGTFYAPTPNGNHGGLILTDSRLTNVGSYMYFAYPRGHSTIARNLFRNSGGISYGIDYNIDPTQTTFTVANNYFINWTTDYALENWAQYGSPTWGDAFIKLNTFADASRIAVKLSPGYLNASMEASLNHWGTTDPAVIESMIYDKRVDVTTNGVIPYQPFLHVPAPDTPRP